VDDESLLIASDTYNLSVDSFGLQQERSHAQSPTEVAFSLAKLRGDMKDTYRYYILAYEDARQERPIEHEYGGPTASQPLPPESTPGQKWTTVPRRVLIYRYSRTRYARAAPTAMPRARRAISLATRWRFT
jgi:hypothetical protein